MANAVTIQVTPEVLQETAGKVKNLSQALQEDFAGLQQVVQNSRYYWEGAAADQYRSTFRQKSSDTEQMLSRISRFPDELLQMAGIYRSAETDNTRRAEALPTNFI